MNKSHAFLKVINYLLFGIAMLFLSIFAIIDLFIDNLVQKGNKDE